MSAEPCRTPALGVGTFRLESVDEKSKKPSYAAAVSLTLRFGGLDFVALVALYDAKLMAGGR